MRINSVPGIQPGIEIKIMYIDGKSYIFVV
ncbi:hypothetical protein ABIC80_000851 [Kosakonia sp. 1610]